LITLRMANTEAHGHKNYTSRKKSTKKLKTRMILNVFKRQ